MTPEEFRVMRDYIEQHCGIHLTREKEYLIETRLTALMVEHGCTNLTQFYRKAVADTSNALRDKIIDAMTTNETLWFRDRSPFTVLSEVLFDRLAGEVRSGTRSAVRIWSAACSTGQEPYSIAISALEHYRRNRRLPPERLEIIATDVSPTVLFLARAGRYDQLAISRGLSPELRDRYFVPDGKVWKIQDEVKRMVSFKKLNLQESFMSLGRMDIIFCRNVLIYFSDEFKRDVLSRMARSLNSPGYLFVGASESLINYTQDFEMLQHERALYYRVKAGGGS